MECGGGVVWVEHQTDARDPRSDLLQDLHLFGDDGILGQRNSREISLRSRKARDETPSKRIADADKHDRDRSSQLLHDRHNAAASDKDHIRLEEDEFRRVGLNPG